MAIEDEIDFGGDGAQYTSSIGIGGGSSYGSSSQGESQSTSEPVSVTTPQTDWGLMQSQLLSALGDQQYKWAMDQYAKGTGVTDQTIQNFMELSGKGRGLADTLLTQYKDQIQPLISKYIADAGSYASEERQRFMAGEAMSTVAQADQAAMDEMERKLGGFGVNVNSGRYQDMMLSARTADAAARAGAGTKAAQDTADRGRMMEEKAIAMGQQMPGQAMNAVNTAYAGLTGAESAILGLMNAGANLTQSAAPFYNAAVGANKIPPVGASSQSTSVQASGSRTPGPQGGASGGGGGSKAAPKGGGGQGQQPKQQPKDPGSKSKSENEKEGGGGGGGPRGAGSANSKATADIGGKAGAGVYNNPTKTEEDPSAGTGAADLTGYTGPIGYIDPNTGTVMPEFSPGLGRDAEGNLLTPGTADWTGTDPNWTLPKGDQGYNVPASFDADGDNPILQLGLPGGTTFNEASPDAFDPYSSFDQGVFPGGDSGELPQGAGSTSGEGYDPWGGQGYDPWGGQDFSQYDDYTYDAGNDFSDWTDQITDYYDNQTDTGYGGDYGSDYYDYDAGSDFSDWTDAGDAGGYDDYSYADDYNSGYDDYNYDAGNDFSDWTDAGDTGGYYDDYSYAGDYNSGYDDYSYAGDYNSGYDAGYYDNSGGYDSYDSGTYADTSGYGGEYYSDYGGDYGDYTYAKGGRVRPDRQRPRPGAGRGVMPTTGGPVPRSASPSRGKQTDDISARLNAGEYVIPKDVVSHQGTKFFTDLIAKSRKLRTGMTGAKPGPTMKQALPPGTRPTFRSRPLPPR